MTAAKMSVPAVDAAFPIGTLDTTWDFAVTGQLEDGTSFSQVVSSDTNSATIDLAAGTYSVVVTKNGIVSLASDSVVVVATPTEVTLSVPDAAQKAVLSVG